MKLFKISISFFLCSSLYCYASINPQPSDGIRQITVRMGTQLDIIATQITNIENSTVSTTTDFQYTWTMIQAVQDTVDALDISSITNNFQQTWTALQAVQDSVDALDISSITSDFQETWTALQAVQNTANTINSTVNTINSTVNTISSDVTTMNNTMISDFQQTWTALQAVQDSVDAVDTDLGVYFGGVTSDFQETWTALQAVQNTANTINSTVNTINSTVNTISSDVTTMNNTMISDFQQTWTILQCEPIAINSSTTINQSGSYCLANNITGQIIIDAENVFLDLNGYAITNPNDSCVVISGTGIVVHSGSLYTASNFDSIHGCVAFDSSYSTKCLNLSCLVGGSTPGINVVSSKNIFITHCQIFHETISGLSGVSCQDVEDVTIEKCQIYGFFNGIVTSAVSTSTSVAIVNNVIAGGNHAIRLWSSSGCVIRNNIMKNNVQGITLFSSAVNTLIFGNIIKDCSGTDSSNRAIQDGGTSSKIYGNFAENNAGGFNYSAGIPLQTAAILADTGPYANISL